MSKYETASERIVVIGSPSFGQGVKYILFGALLGFGAAYYLLGGISKRSVAQKAKEKATQKAGERMDAARESVEETVEHVSENVEERLKSLAARIRTVSGKAKDLVESAGAVAKPALERAIEEGRKTASEVESRLKKEVQEAADKPYLAAQDGEIAFDKEKNGESASPAPTSEKKMQ